MFSFLLITSDFFKLFNNSFVHVFFRHSQLSSLLHLGTNFCHLCLSWSWQHLPIYFFSGDQQDAGEQHRGMPPARDPAIDGRKLWPARKDWNVERKRKTSQTSSQNVHEKVDRRWRWVLTKKIMPSLKLFTLFLINAPQQLFTTLKSYSRQFIMSMRL